MRVNLLSAVLKRNVHGIMIRRQFRMSLQ
jgi:hypothetical protein